MTDLKISALTDGTGIQDGDQFPINRSGSNFRVRAFIAVRATISTTQSIGSGAWTSINWDAEDFDTDSFHDTSTNKNRITIPTGFGGKYDIKAMVQFASSTAGGIRAGQITKNTTTANTNLVGYFSAHQPTNAVSYAQTLDAGIVALSAGDWINLNVYQDSGGNLNFNDLTLAYFQAVKVA